MFVNLFLTTLIHKTGWTRIQKMRPEKRYASTPARGVGGGGEGDTFLERLVCVTYLLNSLAYFCPLSPSPN